MEEFITYKLHVSFYFHIIISLTNRTTQGWIKLEFSFRPPHWKFLGVGYNNNRSRKHLSALLSFNDRDFQALTRCRRRRHRLLFPAAKRPSLPISAGVNQHFGILLPCQCKQETAAAAASWWHHTTSKTVRNLGSIWPPGGRGGSKPQ